MKNIEEKVFIIVAEKLKIDKSSISLQSSFIDDLDADIFDIHELVIAFEEEFGIEIPEEVFSTSMCRTTEPSRTIQDIVTYITTELTNF